MSLGQIAINMLQAAWQILLELAPWLLVGLLIAGILHVFLPAGFIHRHLGGRKFINVFKAVGMGLPMPLCSCGVIPAAIGLKKDGASNGAAIGFLISTPQTGLDCVLVTAAFLGWPFAIFTVFSTLFSGLFGGLLVNLFDPGATSAAAPVLKNNSCCAQHEKRSWKTIFQFGFIELLRDFYKWLIIGILVSALITVFIPQNHLQEIPLTQGLSGMFLMLAITLPLYICTTASIPLAAALVTAGMSPGSALVLLMAGPTTNVATMGAIYHSFGTKVLGIYLATVAGLSIALGLLFDKLPITAHQAPLHTHHQTDILSLAAAIVLLGLLAGLSFVDLRRKFHKKSDSCCCHHPS